ncbi:hypothetical protein NBRC10512_007383 [Rhodotorula toruloides]|uniref:RHTO0S12e02608g1_1 n=2 Tax=Rhodotorula toruloides TaxID=5286 RepID=A0A061B8Q8_RHOTO|nr:uncharacterized protein RHTO_07567 [Rhodotorula toruloides NP11]EMS23225.1 hypothetical protein RHTO_07567 [Rhodotorula toruloides NP11]CDR46305.1 RHTO0S12e02608g1_1 [Rhodotorula toruloides]
MDHRDVAEQLEAGGGQGEAAGSAGGNEMSPRQDGQAPPVPIDGHRLSFTSALKDWFTRSPLSPRTPRQSPRTSPRTPHSGSSTTPRARWSTSSHSHGNPYFPPTSSHVAHPPNVASTSRPHPKRPSRPRSTSAPTGDVPTLQKKGFLARMRLKLGHPGESAVTPANLNPAVVSPGFEQPPASIPAPKVPPFRRAASGPARLLDRNHRERQPRNAGIAVHVQQEEESDRASTPSDVSTLPICCNDAHNYAQTTDTFGDVFADPPSTNDEFDRNSFPVSDDGPGLVSSFPGTQESPTATRDITRSVTRSTSSSPTPRATASGSSSIECFHPFLGAPIYDGPLRVQTRPSSMRQQAYGASWTGLSLGLAPSEQTAGVLSAASTSSRNNRAYSDVWPPPGLVSRFSDWTPTEPERRSSYHSSVFVSLIARHNLGLSSISLHEEKLAARRLAHTFRQLGRRAPPWRLESRLPPAPHAVVSPAHPLPPQEAIRRRSGRLAISRGRGAAGNTAEVFKHHVEVEASVVAVQPFLQIPLTQDGRAEHRLRSRRRGLAEGEQAGVEEVQDADGQRRCADGVKR